MNKALIFAIIAIIIGVIFLSISTVSQNDDFEEEVENESEPIAKPQGRNLSVDLDEKLGLATP